MRDQADPDLTPLELEEEKTVDAMLDTRVDRLLAYLLEEDFGAAAVQLAVLNMAALVIARDVVAAGLRSGYLTTHGGLADPSCPSPIH